ncbi:MAG: hypothetical protein RJQ09_17125 [Cyclobacteriaceae bacterium]
MRNFLLISIFLGLAIGANAQKLSGYYVSDPQMEDYHHFKVHQEDKAATGLMIKAFTSKSDELWQREARLIHGEEAEFVKRKFATGIVIDSVYKLNILMDGSDWEFYLLGYHDHSKDHGAFKVIEEVFAREGDESPLKIAQFEWYKSHHHHSVATTVKE